MKANPFVLGLIAFLLAVAAQQRDLLPDWIPSPIPAPAIDSPFPAEESWLLVAGESSELTGVEVAGNANDIRKAVKNRKILDFDQTAEAPWNAAQDRAKSLGAGKPFYIYRNGSAASEGPLEGSVSKMHATLQKAVGVN